MGLGIVGKQDQIMVDIPSLRGGVVFISRAGEDRTLALQIKQILQDAGFRTYMQDDDFGHASLMEGMAKGFRHVEANGCLLALLSDAYQKKVHCLKEARFPLIDDPSNKKERLVVLRIGECQPHDFLKDIPYVDLVPYLENLSALKERVVGSVQRALRGSAPSEDQNNSRTPPRDAKLDRLVLFLENEDQIEHGKGFLVIAALIFTIGLGFIAFDYGLSFWNRIFGTSYYAIIDTSFVLLAWLVAGIGLGFVLYGQIRETARAIESSNLTPSQLRILRTTISERDWRSKWLVEAAITTAIRNITSRPT